MGKRYMGIAKESVYGTWVAPTYYIDLTSETVAPDNQFINVETGANRAMMKRVAGPYGLGGTVNIPGNTDDLEPFLQAALCKNADVTTATNGGFYQHTMYDKQYIETLACTIAPAVPATAGATDYKLRKLSGGAVRSLTIEANARDIITASADMIFRKDWTGTDAQSPTLSTLNPLVFQQGGLYTGAGAGSIISNVEAFRVTIANNIADDAFVLGSRFLPGIRVQDLTVSGEFDLTMLGWNMYKWFYDGAGSASIAQDATTTPIANFRLQLLCTGEATLNGTYPNYLLQLIFPKVYIDTTRASFDRRNRMVQNVGFTAITGTETATDCVVKAIIVNKRDKM